jgi:glucose/arabinose dehydrogenase/pimeloyl-ACP methyl ester carboxylesterase
MRRRTLFRHVLLYMLLGGLLSVVLVPRLALAEPATSSGPVVLEEGFSLAVYASGLTSPTSMAFDDAGRLFVSQRSGEILILDDSNGDSSLETRHTFASGFSELLGITFKGDILYASSRSKISTLEDTSGDDRADVVQDIITGLPAGRQISWHQNNMPVFGPDDKLYFGIGSTCNLCFEADPRSATIMRYNADGTGEEIYATGLRNPYDIAFHPQDGTMWVADNATNGLGANFPPDELNLIVQGGDYGWPICLGHGSEPFCARAIPPVVWLEPHATPTGTVFYTGQNFPDSYQNDMFIALFGSFDGTVGQKVIRVRLRERDGQYRAVYRDFITGLAGPIDVVVAPDGALLVLDFVDGVLYRVTYGSAPSCDWSDQSYDDFYSVPDYGEFRPDRLGEVLRVEHIRAYTPAEVASSASSMGIVPGPYGAEAYRILYLSQDPVDTPQVVSGLLIVPTGTPPAEGWPLLVHGHPTTGLADVCAPSRNESSVTGSLLHWVSQGYVVTSSDYPGLGMPGVHPYMIGESAGRALLDSGRAALNFCDASREVGGDVASRVLITGHSQGGHAALFAHEKWAQGYAPDLDVLGTVAFAPGSELRYLAQSMASRHLSLLVPETVLALHSYTQYYQQPSSLRWWLNPPYDTTVPQLASQQCIGDLTRSIGTQPRQVFKPGILALVRDGNWGPLGVLTEYLDRNTPGNFQSDAPVLLLHGQRDTLLPAEASELLTQRLCASGTETKLSLYRNAGHGLITRAGLPEALTWMQDRLDGLPAPTSCSP